MNVILYGFKNCGKTSIGGYLAQKLKYRFIDTDNLIEKLYELETGKPKNFHNIYRELGEKGFRLYEQRVIADLKDISKTIVAVGGGAVLNSENIIRLKAMGKLVYLDIQQSVLKTRLLVDSKTVLFDNKNKEEYFERLYLQREPIYRAIADIVLQADQESVKEITDLIIQKIDFMDF